MLLYDIVKFKKDIFKIKKEDAFTDQNVSKEVSRHYASSDKMISQNDSSVNNDYQEDAWKNLILFTLLIQKWNRLSPKRPELRTMSGILSPIPILAYQNF